MYPRLDIDLAKLEENAKTIVDACRADGIDRVFLVVKVLAGDVMTVRRLAGAGFSHLADSRIENLIRFRDIPLPKALMRLPMASEASRVVRDADLSLNSEIDTIRALGAAAVKQGKIHDVILMFDVGDLREGIWHESAYLPVVSATAGTAGIRLAGIGTNLTCYGGVIPDAVNLGALVDIAKTIERELGLKLPIVSGGNSSSVHLLGTHTIPSDINGLRIGEAVFFGRETAYGNPLPAMHRDAFTLYAKLVEAAVKPSFPQGKIGMNSFGEHPDIVDRGLMHRGILAIGRQDVEAANLTPIDARIRIIGASSDHLIVDLRDTGHHVGDVLAFHVDYAGLLRLMTSRYVHKRHRH
ncbi:MAG: hypothetical protein A2Y16_07060 [Tenericutes bacterium GWF2_57_13]|nr:MAG: hypothetical protein A2Y16_07060 [Tenericutes bacterium GWF2_57_13]